MATIGRLKPGQTVYSVERQKMGNTSLSHEVLYSVRIIEVHENYVIASWNNSPAREFHLSAIKKWRVSKPEPKGKVFGINSY